MKRNPFMNALRQPRIALVTGASSGIGRSIAISLTKEGYVVFGAARSIDGMSELAAAGGTALDVDVTDDLRVRNAVEQIIARYGRIDVLVNAAGYGAYGAIEDVSMEAAHRQFEVNVFGYARTIQAVLPHMRQQRSGKIVNITSVGGKIYTPMGGWYHASKFAMEGYSDVLRLEVRPFGIDVVIIEPGTIESRWGVRAIEEANRNSRDGAYQNLLDTYVKIQRTVKSSPPETVARLILKVLDTHRPKARYHVGKSSGIVLFLRRHLSDRLFDQVITALFR
jgi:NAD(P)-dependent dehydrogenase (short-subunit alcohol dehydrogenase family)